jgi:hypothetical protein
LNAFDGDRVQAACPALSESRFGRLWKLHKCVGNEKRVSWPQSSRSQGGGGQQRFPVLWSLIPHSLNAARALVTKAARLSLCTHSRRADCGRVAAQPAILSSLAVVANNPESDFLLGDRSLVNTPNDVLVGAARRCNENEAIITFPLLGACG